jgi:hypothetical protein
MSDFEDYDSEEYAFDDYEFDWSGTEVYQVVTGGLTDFKVLSPILPFDAATKALKEIRRFRKSARLEHWGYNPSLNPEFLKRNPEAAHLGEANV